MKHSRGIVFTWKNQFLELTLNKVSEMEKEKKLSKLAQWWQSHPEPVFDMASLSEKEYKSAMRAIMR